MKYSLSMFLLTCLSSTIVPSDKNPWKLYAQFNHEDTVKGGYFNSAGTLLVTCTQKTGRIFDLKSQQSESFDIGNQLLCLDPTEKFSILSYKEKNSDAVPIIYWPYKKRAPYYDSFVSCLEITPHRCVVQQYGPQKELAGITSEPTPSKSGYWLILRNTKDSTDIIEYYHPYKINDFCFNPHRNIVASITSQPDARIRLLDAEKPHRFIDKIYEQDLYSIRFDETGNRLVAVSTASIDILDITDPYTIKVITSFPNTKHSTQACLSDKYLAVALHSSIKIFNVETKEEIASLPGNNDLSPMDCFDQMGRLLVIINGSKAMVYQKAVPKNNKKHMAIVTGSQDSAEDCFPALCQNPIIKSLSSLLVFLENSFFNC